MNKKTVLILVNHEVVIYNFRKELVRKLVSQEYNVIISCPAGMKLKELEGMGCKVKEVKIDRRNVNPFKDVKLLFDYYKLFNEVKPDIVLTYTIKPNIYGGLVSKLFKIPYISTITGLGSALHKESMIKKIIIMLYKMSLRKAKAIYVQNKSDFDFLVSNSFNKNQLVLVPGSGVNLLEFNLKTYPPPDLTTRFLFIGRVMEEKGIYELLSAAKELESKGHNIEFHIAGFLDDNFQFSKGIPDNVKFLGVVNDVREKISTAHAVILPSYHEGMSNALLEAAATGRPLLASNIPGCREVIDEPYNGYVFKVKSVTSIVEKIETFIQLAYDEKKKMGRASRKKVEIEFDREIIVMSYYNKILEVLK
ncbi:glycosyltransferase family 4 protein [Exiguobacterium aurantiacum]|uniref:glycosyltransferase family 4 protein n=1 Tax=Exiguobacterium aurantiacum TaxID=33987 RepID=UPI003D08BA5F